MGPQGGVNGVIKRPVALELFNEFKTPPPTPTLLKSGDWVMARDRDVGFLTETGDFASLLSTPLEADAVLFTLLKPGEPKDNIVEEEVPTADVSSSTLSCIDCNFPKIEPPRPSEALSVPGLKPLTRCL